MKKFSLLFFVLLISAHAHGQEKPFELVTGGNFFCMLSKKLWTDGRSQVKCWGLGVYYVDPGPQIVPVLANATSIAASRYTACAVDDNKVKCWGYYEAKGENGWAAKATKFFSNLNNVISVSGGSDDICAVDALRGTVCYHGERGDTASTIGGTVKSAVGYGYACGMTPEGRVECWRLHQNACKEKSEKMPADIKQPSELAVSFYQYTSGCSVCAIDNKDVKCWGSAEEQLPEATGLVAPHSIAMIDATTGTQGKGVPCVIDGGIVKCRSPKGKFEPYENFSDIKDASALASSDNLSCVANHLAIKCYYGNSFQKVFYRTPHGVWYQPFKLFELDEALNKLSMDTYRPKADAFRAGERALRTLGPALQGKDREMLRLFVLNAYESVVEFTETEFFTQFLKPNWMALKKQYNEKYTITALKDFPKTDANKLATLELLRGAKTTLQRSLTSPEQVTRVDEFVSAVGKAIALKGNPASLADLSYQFDFLRADVTALSAGAKDRGVALMVLTLVEYLKP